MSPDLSALPENAPKLLLSAPTASAPAFISVALAFSLVFLVTFTLISFRHKMGERLGASLDRPLIQRLSAWIGFFGFMIGMSPRSQLDVVSLMPCRADIFLNHPHVVWEGSSGFQ